MGLDGNCEFDENANPEYGKLYDQRLLKESEESRRLFYVAATRAKKYLALIGERQEVGEGEEIDEQNSFMKQLVWAMNKAGTVEEIDLIDAQSLIFDSNEQNQYPPPFIAQVNSFS